MTDLLPVSQQSIIRLTDFDPATAQAVTALLIAKHRQLAQLDRQPFERSLTAKNYDSSIRACFAWLGSDRLPTNGNLTQWRDEMADGLIRKEGGKAYSVNTINARLAAVRKLLKAVAKDVVDLSAKFALQDWAAVQNLKPSVIQDKIEADYGRRLTIDSFEALVNSPESHLLGLRDRALIAVMGGAGLRVSEAVSLTMRDVFLARNTAYPDQRCIHVRKGGKFGKQRVVVLNSWNSWLIQAVKAYTDALALDTDTHSDRAVFYGMVRTPNADQPYASNRRRLSARSAMRAVSRYEAEYQGEMVFISAHDLRRTYGKLCRQSGMAWEAIQKNYGHKHLKTTQDYVGREVNWEMRAPHWSIKLFGNS